MAVTDIKADTSAGVNKLTRMNNNKLNGGSNTAITRKALTALNSTNDADIYTATYGTHGIGIPIDEKDAKNRSIALQCRHVLGRNIRICLERRTVRRY